MSQPVGENPLVPFSPEEADLIRRAIATEGTKLVCPRCSRVLTSDMPAGGRCSHGEVWELHCQDCRKSILVPDYQM